MGGCVHVVDHPHPPARTPSGITLSGPRAAATAHRGRAGARFGGRRAIIGKPHAAACRPAPPTRGAGRCPRPPVTARHPTGASRRRSHDELVAGVASGVGDHFNIEPNLVRLAFVVLTFAGGAGVVLYAAGWLFLPDRRPDRRRAAATRGDRSRERPGAGRSRSARSRSACCWSRVDRARVQRRAPVAARARRHGHRVDRRSQRSPDRRADRRARPS